MGDFRGSFWVTDREVKSNQIGWTEIDFVKSYIEPYKYSNPGFGWYAYKFENGIHKFLLCAGGVIRSDKYLNELIKDGYKLA